MRLLVSVLGALVVVGALFVAPKLDGSSSSGTHHNASGAILTGATDFTLTGTVSNLAPGVGSSLVVTGTNSLSVPVTVGSLTVSVTTVPSTCPASNLTLNGTAFTGTTPAVTVTSFSPAWVIPAGGTASTTLPILLSSSASNSGCQNVTFGFTYVGAGTVPTGPGAPSLTGGAGNGQATFSWTVPDNGGSPITSYTVTCSPSGSVTVDGSTTTATITGLTNGVTYTCTVTATNAIGSATSSSVTVTPAGPPVPAPATTTAALTPPSTPAISITSSPKTQSIASGATATFAITVLNNGNVTLTGVAVTDPKAAGCARSIGTLTAGASKSYKCSLEGATAGFTNIATATGTGSTKVSASTQAIVKVATFTPPAHSALSIAKSPKSQTVTTSIITHRTLTTSKVTVTRGNAHFTIKVTNTGATTLHGITVSDAHTASCKHSLGTLAPGASHTYTCVATAVKTSFTNLAVVTGTSPAGGKITARSSANVKVKTTKATITMLTIPDVLFAFNKSTLLPDATAPLTRILKGLTTVYRKGHITVTGYTDSIGTFAYNIGLSRARATTVATWLEQHGIPTGRITISWKGEADPVATNTTAAGRQQNRRVTIAIRVDH